ARGHLAKAREMVLDEECTDIAEGLCLNVALDEFSEAGPTVNVRTTSLCLGTPKESKTHSLLLFLTSAVYYAHLGNIQWHTILQIGRHCNAALGLCGPRAPLR